MIGEWFKYVVLFFALLFLQLFVLNNIQFSGYINPFAYILLILVLPLNTPRWLVMMTGFILGLSIDIYTRTPGMHASAAVFIGFVRRRILTILSPREGYEFGAQPTVSDMGFLWFFAYSSIIIVLHHSWLFLIEDFTLSHVGHVFVKVVLSSLFTLTVIFIIQLLSYKPTKG